MPAALLVVVGCILGGTPGGSSAGATAASPLIGPLSCANPVNLTATATPSTGVAPLTVAFRANLTGGCPPYEFEWEFGDEGEGGGLSVSHTYQSAGTFNALVHADGANNSSARFALLIVVVGGSGNFRVGVQAMPATGAAPLAVTFWANVTGGNTSGPLQTNWDFGDGGSGAGSPVTHAYTTPGSYSANATVSDQYGHHATGTVAVEVGPPSGSPAPNLSLQVSPSDGTPPLNTSILAFSNGFASVDQLEVCFGDSTPCSRGPVGWNGTDPVLFAHQYTATGTYTIYGTLTNAIGSVVAGATASVVVSPSAALQVQGSAHPLGGGAPLTVRFQATVAGGTAPYTIQWRFGDGASGSSVVGGYVDHTYAAAGEYHASVTVLDSAGHESGIAVGPIAVHATSTIFTGLPSQLLGIPSVTWVGLGLGAAVAAAAVVEVLLVARHRRKLRKEGEQLVRGLEQRR